MNVLAIECSCQTGSVAVLKDGAILRSREFDSPRGRGAEMFDHLESALRDGTSPDLVVVGTGPGRYNGLRASISAAWGIARARGARLAGVPSLLGFGAPEYFVVGDARSGQWFFAHVAGGKFLSPPALAAPHDVRRFLRPGIPVFATSPLDGLPEALVAAPSACVLAGRDGVEGVPAPAYLKPPHITKPAGRTIRG
ncbi:MAG: tRNA threonylcarbamoyladenosine biosynthesis protein TsaB [Terrimicrobiaceae bacterium]|jgi:tRNA A37 threonylcarbamoyladenosine modification protein TsaB